MLSQPWPLLSRAPDDRAAPVRCSHSDEPPWAPRARASCDEDSGLGSPASTATKDGLWRRKDDGVRDRIPGVVGACVRTHS